MNKTEQIEAMGATFDELDAMVIGGEFEISAMSILSDIQESITRGCFNGNDIKKSLNIAKYYISVGRKARK